MTTNNFDTAYPPELREYEARLVRKRQEAAGPRQPHQAEQVGFALSGGGIRSATFCLGFFQGLAKLRLIRRIDYLSTVSGGGFFGSFLGRLFTREYVEKVDDVEDILTQGFWGRRRVAEGKGAKPDVLQWLRDNGRYLSPRGSGDLLLGLTVLMRNWVAVQVILVALVLMVILTAQLVHAGIAQVRPQWVAAAQEWMAYWPGAGGSMWWSAYGIVILPLLVLWIFPVGWAYWVLAGRERANKRWIINEWAAWLIGLAIAFVGLWLVGDELRPAFAAVVAAGIVAGLWTRAALFAARRMVDSQPDGALYRDEFARHWISEKLKSAVIVTVGVFAFVLVDSLGQTVYLLMVSPESTIEGWAAGIVAGLVAFAAFARQIAVLFGSRAPAKPVRIPLAILAAVAAILIAGFVLTVLDAASHAIAWRYARPAGAPLVAAPAPRPVIDAPMLSIRPADGGWVALRKTDESEPVPARSQRDLRNLGIGLAIALAFSLLFGRTWPALKYSSHHPLYSARLIRAYLGASNPRRSGQVNPTPVVNVIPGDDISTQDYYQPAGMSPFDRGAPLHLINVTVNETIHGRSQLQQQDRKGVGMAVGPAGLSAGIRHHVILKPGGQCNGKPAASVYPRQDGTTPYRMFEYAACYEGEALSVGQWAGISGAAFSTGLGYRTSVALSLLSGFGNVRLGYWWHSGIARRSPVRSAFARAWRALFPVQSFLLDEFLARLRGSAQDYWYLSDGGHFENMGGYELIRRRLPLIVVIDAEADPSYAFDGLANLVRKARLDFQAEIRFLSDRELDDCLGASVRPFFGPLERLRRGAWSEEYVPGATNGESVRRFACNDDPARFSLAHAALARVYYDGNEDASSWLLYIKPTLIGDEPADILEYHADHPEFPQEPTVDQFFDEAQWESYRRLGEHIALHLFQQPAAGEPERMFVPGAFAVPTRAEVG